MNIEIHHKKTKELAKKQLIQAQKDRKLTRYGMAMLLKKLGHKISLQSYYDLINGVHSTDTTVEQVTEILNLLKTDKE